MAGSLAAAIAIAKGGGGFLEWAAGAIARGSGRSKTAELTPIRPLRMRERLSGYPTQNRTMKAHQQKSTIFN
jgi:hypothetical protein